MDHLMSGNFRASLQLLKRAQDLLGSPSDANLTAITLNNFGCYFKKLGKTKQALFYLQNALRLEVRSPAEKTNLAGTHLNMCAIYSQQGDHVRALSHAQEALSLLKEAQHSDSLPNILTTMIIALHNLAVEYEFLNRTQEAISTYKQAYEMSRKNLGTSHQLTDSLYKSLQSLLTLSKKRATSSGHNKTKRKNILPKIRTTSYGHKDVNSLHLLEWEAMPKVSEKTRRAIRLPEKIHKIQLDKKIDMLKDQVDKFQEHYDNLKAMRNSQENRSRPKHIVFRKHRPKTEEKKPEKPNSLEDKTQKALRELEELKKMMEMEKRNELFPNKPLDVIPESNREEKPNGVVLIQTAFRAFVLRKWLDRNRKAAVVIQKHVRRFQCFTLFSLVKSAIVFLQAYWRGYRARKTLKNKP